MLITLSTSIKQSHSKQVTQSLEPSPVCLQFDQLRYEALKTELLDNLKERRRKQDSKREELQSVKYPPITSSLEEASLVLSQEQFKNPSEAMHHYENIVRCKKRIGCSLNPSVYSKSVEVIESAGHLPQKSQDGNSSHTIRTNRLRRRRRRRNDDYCIPTEWGITKTQTKRLRDQVRERTLPIGAEGVASMVTINEKNQRFKSISREMDASNHYYHNHQELMCGSPHRSRDMCCSVSDASEKDRQAAVGTFSTPLVPIKTTTPVTISSQSPISCRPRLVPIRDVRVPYLCF